MTDALAQAQCHHREPLVGESGDVGALLGKDGQADGTSTPGEQDKVGGDSNRLRDIP
jgi:hypothetical protein